MPGFTSLTGMTVEAADKGSSRPAASRSVQVARPNSIRGLPLLGRPGPPAGWQRHARLYQWLTGFRPSGTVAGLDSHGDLAAVRARAVFPSRRERDWCVPWLVVVYLIAE